MSRRAALRMLGAAAGTTAITAALPEAAQGATPGRTATASATTKARDKAPAVAVPVRLIADDGFNYSALTALGMAGYGVTEVGEVLTAVAAINTAAGSGDPYPAYAQAYTDTFTTAGNTLARRAGAATGSRDRVSAADCALRGSQYYAQALFYVLGTDNPAGELGLYAKCKANWETFLANTRVQVRPLPIRYAGTHMPAWIFTPDHEFRTARPTIILTNGSDGQSADLWAYGAAAALQRGWNAVIYEGPGQGQMIFERKIPFTASWEDVVTPIVDALYRRPDVDRRRIVLTGLSMGGNLAARAAAYEHRLAALVCEPGVVAPWLGFPASIQQLVVPDQTTTNANWAKVVNSGHLTPDLRFLLAKRFEPFSAEAIAAARAGQLPTDLWTPAQTLLAMDITHTAGRISCPTLVLDYEGERFYPGQPTQLYNLLPGRLDKTYLQLTAADGAQLHCSPMAPQHHNETIFNWLDQHLHIH